MHEDLIAWDEDERKQCRDEWYARVCSAIDTTQPKQPYLHDATYEAGLAAVRELRKLRRLNDTARTVRA